MSVLGPVRLCWRHDTPIPSAARLATLRPFSCFLSLTLSQSHIIKLNSLNLTTDFNLFSTMH